MNKEIVLEYINELIEEEHGKPINYEDTILSSGVDSFGLTMVLVGIDHKYNIYPKDIFASLDFAKITPKDVVDRILNGNK